MQNNNLQIAYSIILYFFVWHWTCLFKRFTLKGRSPECWRICVRKILDAVNDLLQYTHLYGLSPLCTWNQSKEIQIHTVFHHCVPESKQRNTHLYDLSPLCTWIKATKIHIYTVFHHCVSESKQRKYTFIRPFTAVYLNQSKENTHCYGLSPLCTWIKTKKIHMYTVFHRCVPESNQRKYTFMPSFTTVYLNQSKENTHLYGLSPLCTWIKATKIHMYTVFHHCVSESKQRKYTFMRSFTAVYMNQSKENTHVYGLSPLCTWIKAKKHTFIRSFTARYPNENKEIHIYAVFHHCVPKQIPLGFDVL